MNRQHHGVNRVRGTQSYVVLALALVMSFSLILLPDGDGVGSTTKVSSSQQFRTLFGNRTPKHARMKKTTKKREVGSEFAPRVDGQVHGVRLWKASGRTGRRVAYLRDAHGSVLATARLSKKRARGWQRVLFPEPVQISKGQHYVVSYRLAAGSRVVTRVRRMKSASRSLSLVGGVTRPKALEGGERSRRSTQFWVDALFAPNRGSGSTQDPTTTTTPTTTPTAQPGECAKVPSSCGYPDATNTGLAAGVSLTRVPGDITSGAGWSWNATYQTVFVTGAGAVLEGLDISGAVAIGAPNVTLRNSRIASCGGSDDSDVVAIRHRPEEGLNATSARVIANEINGTPAGCSRRARSGVRDVYGAAPDALVQGNNIYGSGNGVTIEHQGLVADNWVHDLGHVAGDHHSGLSNHGGAVGVVFRHNTVLLHGQKFAGGGGVSGALTVYSDFAHAQNVTLEDNLISGGSYVIYGGDSGDASNAYGPATSIKIRSNRFVCGDWLYGPLAAFSDNSPGNEFTGNVCDVTAAPVSP